MSEKEMLDKVMNLKEIVSLKLKINGGNIYCAIIGK